jgi:small-conductance mechanosensitive channel
MVFQPLYTEELELDDNLLPQLEIDDNENSQRILERFFELISTRWAGGNIELYLNNLDTKVGKLSLEFDKKLSLSDIRLKELTHLIESQPNHAPYFNSFYFRQLVDLKTSFTGITNTLQSYQLELETLNDERENQLLMVKQLKLKYPELQWQKNWIISNVQPIINSYKKWLHKLDNHITKAEAFEKRIQKTFDVASREIEDNYKRFYWYQFIYLGNSKGYRVQFQLEGLHRLFRDWQFTFWNIILVILPNYSYIQQLLVYFVIFLTLSIIGAFILHRYTKTTLKRFISSYILLSISLYFIFCVVYLPSTNDIVIFTIASFFLSICGLDIAWKIRQKKRNMPNMPNPFLCQIILLSIIDLLMSLLIPIKLLLTAIVLMSILVTIWLIVSLIIYKYKKTETCLACILPIFSWIAAGIAAWIGYLYPAMTIAVSVGLLVCTIYVGIVLTQTLVEFAAKISNRHLSTSFVFTLLIPLLWLCLIIGSFRWGGQIFNAGRILQNLFESNILPNPNITISPKTVLFIILFCLFLKFFLNWVKHMLDILSSSGRFDSGSLHSGFQIFQYLTWSAFCVYVLNSMNIDWNNIKIVIGGLSVGFGFALKELLENFVCGLILLIGKEVRPGDIVEFDGTMGKVEKINIRATFIKTYDNAIITLPNNQVVSKDFRNWTLNGHAMRTELNVGVAYGSDIEKVVEMLLESTQECSMVLKVKDPEVLFMDFADSSLIFRLRFWIHIDNIAKAPSALRFQIEKLFNQANIVVAFPQMDIHFDETSTLTRPPVKQLDVPNENTQIQKITAKESHKQKKDRKVSSD